MEVVASPQHLGDSFSGGWLKCAAPSFERLAVVDASSDLLAHSFGSSTRSFIDMDPAELFSMRWATTDFDFGLLPPDYAGDDNSPSSPMLVSASQIIRDGRLLPCEPAAARRRSGSVLQLQEHEDHRVVTSAPRSPAYHSAQSTPASLSSCSSTRSANKALPPPPLSEAGRRRGSNRASTSSWKILVRYLRFLVPLYRKIRALRQFSAAAAAARAPRVRVAPASPARASTSSLEWCHGNADTAVRDAILYCKKSSGQA